MPEPIAETAPYIFISYARPNQQAAEQVEAYLTQANFRVFRDTCDIHSGDNWDMTIEQALRETDRMVLLLSSTSMPYRKEVHREWFFYDQQGKPIHPLYLDKCELHSRLYAYNYIDARPGLAAALERLGRDLVQDFGAVDAPHTRDRILVNENAEERSMSDALHGLLEAVRDDSRDVALTPQQVAQIVKHHPKNMTEYRLGRIAEWSQPRYQLDNRFVYLSLLIDQGETAEGQRWVIPRPEPYRDLRKILEERDEAALVLLGAPGSGKSTLLRRLQLDDAIDRVRDDGEQLTFFIQLNQYKPASPDLPLEAPRQWLTRRWEERNPDLPAFDDLLREGRLLLLLDALNEMPHRNPADYREHIGLWRHFLQETLADNPGNRVVFSCRSLDYSAPLSSDVLPVPQIRIEPLSPEQVQDFLRVYIPGLADLVWGQLHNSPQFDLFRNPYFLKLLIDQVETDEGRIPEGRAELFTGFVRQALRREIRRDNRLMQPNGLLTDRDHRRIIDWKWRHTHELPERGCLIPKISELAYKMQVSRIESEAFQVRVEYDNACRLVNHERDADILHAGISLNTLDEDLEEVFFFHQLLQEFFAARYLAANPTPDLVRVEWRADRVQPSLPDTLAQIGDSDPLPPLPGTGWEETTVLAAAITRDPEAFVAALMDADLPLAGRCAATPDVKISETLKNSIRQALIDRTQDPQADLRARIAAGLALGHLGDPRFERRSGPHGDYLMPPLIDISGDTYTIGSDEGYDDEKPPHPVPVAAFRIGQFPVTNAEYALFIAAGGYEDEQWWDTAEAKAWRRGEGSTEGSKSQAREIRGVLQRNPGQIKDLLAQDRITSEQAEGYEAIVRMNDTEFEDLLDEWYPSGKRFTEPEFWSDEAFNNPNQPVVGITWFEARAYCNWLAAQTGIPFRLPTEAEWEAAARGTEGRQFAYAGDFDAALCNIFETHVRRTTPIGVFPGGDTPEGCVDMAGNTWDWTSTTYEPYPYDAGDGREDAGRTEPRRVLRGGSWDYDLDNARAAYRYVSTPYYRRYNVGFRAGVAFPILL